MRSLFIGVLACLLLAQTPTLAQAPAMEAESAKPKEVPLEAGDYFYCAIAYAEGAKQFKDSAKDLEDAAAAVTIKGDKMTVGWKEAEITALKAEVRRTYTDGMQGLEAQSLIAWREDQVLDCDLMGVDEDRMF